MAGLAITFGSGAQTNNIQDFNNAACIMSIGSNTTAAHPIIGFTVKQAVQRGTKLIVINSPQNPFQAGRVERGTRSNVRPVKWGLGPMAPAGSGAEPHGVRL